jgi:hypothetical protein
MVALDCLLSLRECSNYERLTPLYAQTCRVHISENRRSAIGFLAMTDGMNAEGVIRFFGEADAVVADTEAQLAGLSLELLDVALASLGEAKKCGKDAHGGVAIETTDVGAGALGPGDFLHA